ncbi:hypothetical protein B0T14DRAFT_574459 [Immersiella caudata]|uniref:Uncharacterized protein n=1 Tax=Immersiella caudata TaxID=314043 RepID=A0AA39XF09_9PEZI|nr:hypothetical protein B0T14DRAFT_574459 [Immersiella caudata]
MKFAYEAFFLAILATVANSQPSNDANDISRPPSPLPLSEAPATTPSPSPSTNPNSASEWLQTISMTQNQPPKISRPSRLPPKSSATQTVSEEACTPSGSASGSPTTSEAPSQTEEIRLPMGYIDATSLQWVFTWRKCGGGYESVQSSTSTKQEVFEFEFGGGRWGGEFKHGFALEFHYDAVRAGMDDDGDDHGDEVDYGDGDDYGSCFEGGYADDEAAVRGLSLHG